MDSAFVPEGAGLFGAMLVYEASSSARNYAPLYEETVTLLVAESEEEAMRKARLFGKEREHSYKNGYGETITWKLKHVIDVYEIRNTLGDGAEVHSRFFRNYRAYETFEAQLGKIEL